MWSCCDVSKLTCKHVLTEENCKVMLKSSSWVGFTVLGNAFKCGCTSCEEESTIINTKVCSGLQGESLPWIPLSLRWKRRMLWKRTYLLVQRHQTNATSVFCFSLTWLQGHNKSDTSSYEVCLSNCGWRKHIHNFLWDTECILNSSRKK